MTRAAGRCANVVASHVALLGHVSDGGFPTNSAPAAACVQPHSMAGSPDTAAAQT